MRDGPPVLVTIERIAAGGAGVGRLPDGRTVFVQRTAPGETVDIRVTQEKRRWAKGRLEGVRSPSDIRRVAPCRFYARCGGCTLEHLEYAAQLEAKSGIVADAVQRIGGIAVALPNIVASPDEFRYRNRVSFKLIRLAGGRVVAGFHEIDEPARVLDVTGDCLLPEPIVAGAWDALRASWGPGAERLPGGPRLRVTIRAGANGKTALLVEGGRDGGRATELLDHVPGLESIWYRADARDAPVLLAGAESVTENWADETLAVTGAMFLQVNRRAAALLEDYVISLAGEVAGLKVIDAYAGVGLHARRLARAGARVFAIERDAEAVREGRRSSMLEFEFAEGDVADLLPGALPADLVIVNPPRSGLTAEVTDALMARPAERVIYISCDPATLARDLARVAPRFHLQSLRCFDLFPQTAHVETVAELACATS